MIIRLFIIIMLITAAGADSWAAKSALPLPRFASLRSSEVNVRTGPGPRYQIKWVLNKKELPVEIIAEFDQWRKIRDISGDEGWVHKGMIAGKRSAIINGQAGGQNAGQFTLYRSPDGIRPVLFVENGVIGEILTCKADWCRLKIEGTKGWIEKKNIWGAYSEEEFN